MKLLKKYRKTALLRITAILIFSYVMFRKVFKVIWSMSDKEFQDISSNISLFYVTIAIGLGALSHLYNRSTKSIETKTYELDLLLIIVLSFHSYFYSLDISSIQWAKTTIICAAIVILYIFIQFAFTLFDNIDEDVTNHSWKKS